METKVTPLEGIAYGLNHSVWHSDRCLFVLFSTVAYSGRIVLFREFLPVLVAFLDFLSCFLFSSVLTTLISLFGTFKYLR